MLLIIRKIATRRKSSLISKGVDHKVKRVDIQTLVLVGIGVRVCIGILTNIEQQQQAILKIKGDLNSG